MGHIAAPAVEYQIIRVKVSHPAKVWYLRSLISQRRFLFLKGLSISLRTWRALLKCLVELMPPQATSSRPQTWLIPVNSHVSLEVSIRVAICGPITSDETIYSCQTRKNTVDQVLNFVIHQLRMRYVSTRVGLSLIYHHCVKQNPIFYYQLTCLTFF